MNEGEYIPNRHAKIALFTQYHMDQLDLEQSAIEFIIEKFDINSDNKLYSSDITL